jgi:hypothetical protein
MGLICTTSGFCFVECDTWNCNKKVEHSDEGRLRELAGWCGWENRDHQWICPNCAEIPSKGTRKASKSRLKTQISSEK